MFGIVNFYYRQVYCFYLTSEEREVDFESSASANFTTPASVLFYHASAIGDLKKNFSITVILPLIYFENHCGPSSQLPSANLFYLHSRQSARG